MSPHYALLDNRHLRIRPLFALALLLGLSVLSDPDALCKAQEIRFSRDVLPILSDRCFHCHGPDEANREADLRLDLEVQAKADLGGYAAISPGDLQRSEIWQRVTSEDEDLLMPPQDSHRKPLSTREREILREWILQGAKWGKHWAFEPPQKLEVPKGENPVDYFVGKKLKEAGLQPSEPAAAHTQLRRLYLTLSGLSPPPELVAAAGQPSPEQWAAIVQDVLQSPPHAERMAMWWLDAARYSDSDGFQQDATRENWPWRDWVIRAFQENKPFDEFTIEQFAGDLLAEASQEQILATCFHRNHMTNGEGGRDPEESRVDYVIDRVNTTGTVWLGLTLGCVQCHSHKFDPISQQDYYSLAAFFNSIAEDGKAGKNAKPYLKYTPTTAKQHVEPMQSFVRSCEQLETRARSAAEARFQKELRKLWNSREAAQPSWRTAHPVVSSTEGTCFDVDSEGIVHTSGPDLMHDDYRLQFSVPRDMNRIGGWRLEVLPHESHQRGRFSRFGNGEFALTGVKMLVRRQGSPAEQPLEISAAIADYEAAKNRKTDWDLRYAPIAKTLNDDARDGWTTEGAAEIEPHVGVFTLAEAWLPESGDQVIVWLSHRSTHGHANIGRLRISFTAEVGETLRRTDGGSPIEDFYAADLAELTDLDAKLRSRLFQQFLLSDPEYQTALAQLQVARKQLKDLQQQAKSRSVMVLNERDKPRPTHVLQRGVWNAKGDVVSRAVIPSILKRAPEQSQTRLDLAKWLVDRQNPLTARVVVNHLWQLLFGSGLVRTPEDFGLQGQRPTHPELLDWLAVDLVEHDWDLRHVLHTVATSDTFRQSSRLTSKLAEIDPENQLLARAPRYRLPAWMVRDNSLYVSGLLNRSVGGPPMFPYQPQGVWSEITMGRFHYEPSLGPNQYRRTVYAFWRRSSAPAFLFDSAQRRVCEVAQRRTNTPLHALTLMNDTTMLECSRALADHAACEATPEDALELLGLRVLQRRLTASEREHMVRVFDTSRKHFVESSKAAAMYTKVGQQPSADADQSAAIAAWMTVASLMLNLDEAISIE